jgi:alpha-tubulin suppressor-like RCC1 family protein
VQIGTLNNWASVTCAYPSRIMAIKTDGTLWAWGNNSQGILGIGDSVTRSSPVQVGTLNTWVSASIGNTTALLLQNNGYALSTGGAPANGYPQNPFVSRSSPIQIGRFETNNESVDTPNFNGSVQVLVKKTDGSLWSWGTNTSGQLGDGTSISRSSPVQIGNVTYWKEYSAGGNSFIGIQEF